MTVRLTRLMTSALLFLSVASQSAMASGEDRWVFRAFLDDKPIGYHEFRVSENGDDRQVESRAEFDVKFLFFNAYSYMHRNTESWSQNCLRGIEAVTDANGEQFRVYGQHAENGFRLETGDNSGTLKSECIRSFAYWNPVILESKRLLNSQTGEILNVTVVPHGPDTLSVGTNRIAAEKFVIEMQDGPITLWYSADSGQWVALEAPAKGGRMLRYEPVVLPGQAQESIELAMD
jgi:hypothetical protein